MANLAIVNYRYTEREIIRFWTKVQKRGPDECWSWLGTPSSNDYGRMKVGRSHIDRHSVLAHRMSYEINIAPIANPLMKVCHECDNPICVNPNHLFLGTQAENLEDMTRKRRQCRGDRHRSVLHPELLPHGEDHWAHKWTIETVRKVRSLFKGGMPQCDISRSTGVSTGMVYRIVRGKSWAHVA